MECLNLFVGINPIRDTGYTRINAGEETYATVDTKRIKAHQYTIVEKGASGITFALATASNFKPASAQHVVSD